MKSLFFVALGLIALVVRGSDVIDINGEAHFQEAVTQNNLIMVEFFAPWCGHCKKLAPEYETAATQVKEEGLTFAKVDATTEENQALASAFAVRGYPTLKLFRNGQYAADYQGGRTAADLVNYMRRQALPSVSEFTSAEELESAKKNNKVLVVGFFENKESEEYKQYIASAERLRESFTFGAVFDSTVAGSQEVFAFPTVVLFKQFDEGKAVLPAADLATLESFVVANSLPLLDEVGPTNYNFYMSTGKPIVFVFLELGKAGEKESFTQKLSEIARRTKGKLNWVFIDQAKYGRYGERLGLSGQVVPAIAIEVPSGPHYAFDEQTIITETTVNQWIDSYLSGELKPTIKSEPIPATNDEPVKVVVADSFGDLVLNNDKDVLVEFYAPWCGHCKNLAPIYEDLASSLSSVDTLVITKIDATANDVDPKFNVQGFPTIKLFAAGKKDTPIDYQGERTKEGFLTFLSESATHKFEVPSGKTEL